MKNRIFLVRQITETQLKRLRSEGCTVRDLNRHVNAWMRHRGWAVTVSNERQLTLLMLTVETEFLSEMDQFLKWLDGN